MYEASQSRYQVVILGSGPAGLTAAIYASRANLAPLVLEGAQPGGQLTITTDVENFPGFPEGIMGPELMERMREQAKRFGSEVIQSSVTKIDFDKRPYTLHLENLLGDTQTIEADTIIVATGATARLLGLASESELMGYGVSACATCDGAFFQGKEVVVVGGGDSAMEEAVFLTRFASKVTIVHRREGLRASKVMIERAQKNPKIAWKLNETIEVINGTKETGVQSITLRNTQSNALTEYPAEGVFMAIGHVPNTSLFKEVLDMDEKGYLITEPERTKTKMAGIFAAGDVKDSFYRQAISAAGSGCSAAIEAERYLEELGE